MTPFLQQIASAYYDKYGKGIKDLAFVFPNRRSGLFFRKYLAEIAEQPIFSPTILTINEIFLLLSKKQIADRIQMLFLLYQVYNLKSQIKEPFDDFVFWGEMILNDFDDIDKYMVDAQQLFTNISDLKNIDSDFSYLQENQIRAIRSFWSSFHPKSDGVNQQFFLNIWGNLFPIYKEFKNVLAQEGIGYEGMIAREVIENLKQDKINDELNFEKIVFIGLNAITTVEYELMMYLQKSGLGEFYWDCGSSILLDPNNRASFFIKDHLKKFPSALNLMSENDKTPIFELIGVPSRIGQAKEVYNILERIIQEQPEMSAEEALKIAIVLPDEQLLLPVLNSIPEKINGINVTVGYPLSATPIVSLIELILQLHKNIRMVDVGVKFYFRDVLSILNHQYIVSVAREDSQKIVNDIKNNNRIYVSSEELCHNDLFIAIFSQLSDGLHISDFLLVILNQLVELLKPVQNLDCDQNCVEANQLNTEFIFQYYTVINRLKQLTAENQVQMSLDTYLRFLKRLTDLITVPFQGEPLNGIQIMGILETRVLDFDQLIILSMNEGIFPLKKTTGSFIPYNLRKGFGLPTFEHQDSVWAYHFYRLIARAKKVTFLYDTRTEGMQSGEISRYIHQLRFHYNFIIDERLMVYNISSSNFTPILIEKTDQIMEKMSHYLIGGDRALSASTINKYLDCPLKFYFSYIENMEEEEDVLESIENRTFGNILHKTMEILYKPFSNSMVTADILKITAKEINVTQAIQKAFAELFFHSSEVRKLTGQNYLTGEMIRKYVLKIIDRDRLLTPFHYIESERKINQTFKLSNGLEVQLKGFIDRLDEVNKTIRVIDYKSGTQKSTEFLSIADLFNSSNEKRQQAIMQVFTYAWMFYKKNPNKPIQPVIYYARDLFSNNFNPAIYIGKEKNIITDFKYYVVEFEDAMQACLDEMFDPTVPFRQTKNNKICIYCSYANICGQKIIN